MSMPDVTITVPADTSALIFDLDGTLADTMPLHYKAWRQMLDEHSVEFPEALFYEFAGMPTERIIETLNRTHGKSMHPREMAERKESFFDATLHEVQPVHAVLDLAKDFHGRLPMAVASGGLRWIVNKTLGLMKIEHLFDAVVCADDVEHGKPAPDTFLEAARRLNAEPSRAVVFEDGELGFQAARAAGMRLIDVRPFYARPIADAVADATARR